MNFRIHSAAHLNGPCYGNAAANGSDLNDDKQFLFMARLVHNSWDSSCPLDIRGISGDQNMF